MTKISVFIRHMFKLGATEEQVMAALEEYEEAIRPKTSAERVRKCRTRCNDVTLHADIKEAPHTPQENIYIYNKPKNEKRGTRLPSGWEPSSESLLYAQKLGFSASEIDEMAEEMRLWAASASGKVAVKRDWESAFKGWCRRAKRDRKPLKLNVIQGSFRPPVVKPEPEGPKISEAERQANLEKLAKLKFQPKGI